MRVRLAMVVVLVALVALPAGAAEAAAGKRCPFVTITPNSGDGLFKIRVKHVGCKPARRLLLGWARQGYPGAGPGGYTCRTVKQYPAGNSRVACRDGRKSIRFDTGL